MDDQSANHQQHKGTFTLQQVQVMTINQLLTAIYEEQNIHHTFWQEVALHARLLEYTEQQYKALRSVVSAWINLVKALNSGEPVTSEWGVTRDALLAQARPLIDDDPIEI